MFSTAPISHSRIRYPSSSDFSPMMRPAPPTWRKPAGETALPARTAAQAYLNEFTFRFNRRFYPFNAFRSLLGIAGDTSAPTYAELYSGEWRHPTCSGHGR